MAIFYLHPFTMSQKDCRPSYKQGRACHEGGGFSLTIDRVDSKRKIIQALGLKLYDKDKVFKE
ncbi:MAG: hypothetical protein HZB80_10750 [Deltaproteobacteria bacterium]|nr:hypothetical protein [Deltaproteobacteria bacterium]